MRMKSKITLAILLLTSALSAQICNTSGNVIIYANYDGGALTINVDEDIPNLRIGVCTYEACEITITGPFASNVTEVVYAGFDADNDHCNLNLTATSINAPAGVVTEVLFAPPSVLADSNGNSSMVCAFNCPGSTTGGCNTAEQVIAYFLNQFGGELYYYFAQYPCWASGGYAVSNGGTCCPEDTELPPVAAIDASDGLICAGECITVSDASVGSPTQWEWGFEGATNEVSGAQNPGSICYDNAGSYQVTLTVSNALGSSTTTYTVEVSGCGVEGIPGCMYPQAVNYNPTATVDDLSCEFICNDSCPGDLDDNGVVGVTDLLLFIAIYSSVCPN